MKFRLVWVCTLLAWIWLVFTTSGLTQANPRFSQETFRLAVTPAFAGNYVPGTWFPLVISLTNTGTTTEARITATLPGIPNRYTRTLGMPQNSQKDATLYIPMERPVRIIQVEVTQADGSRVAQANIEVRPRVGERLLGIVSDQALDLNLPRRQNITQLPFVTFALPPSQLPDVAAGLGSVTLLLLHDIAPGGLSAAQQQALTGWVANGGHLVVGGGAINAAMIAELPAELRLAAAGEPLDLNPALAGAFAGGAAPAALPGIALLPVAGTTSFGAGGAPLWVQHAVGKGRVTQLAFHPGQEILRTWDAAPRFWERLLQPGQLVNGLFGTETTLDTLQEQHLTNAVSQLPPGNVPQSTLLFGLLLLYAVFAAPGLALVLRRRDRQVWMWIVVPGTALFCGTLAFWLALALRADQRIISHVSLVEQVDAAHARTRTLTALLAPQDTIFRLHVPADALVRPLRSAATSAGAVSGVVGSFEQQAENLAVPVERWQIQGVIAEQQVAFPMPDAQIVLDEQGIRARVHNTTEQYLRHTVVALGRQHVALGDIAPGEESTAWWPIAGAPGESNRSSILTPTQALPPGEIRQRETLVQAALPEDTRQERATPVLLGWLDHSPLPVSVDAAGAATRQNTLLVAEPRITGSGTVVIPADWVQVNLPPGSSGICTLGGTRGFVARTNPLTVTLQLPRDLMALQATEITIRLDSANTAPHATIMELFDWQQGRRVGIAYAEPDTIQVPAAAPYMQQGIVSLRLDGNVPERGCMRVTAHLTGVLP